MLDHFVEAARADGCSWGQIGSALGVSKQAVQQRHKPVDALTRRVVAGLSEFLLSGRRSALERFTPEARAAVVHAQAATRDLGHPVVGPEHLLLGLMAVPDGIVARTMEAMGAAEALIESVKESAGTGPGSPRQLPFAPSAKAILEGSHREALALGHEKIGPEHILFALNKPGSSPVADLLLQHGLTRKGVLPVIWQLRDSGAEGERADSGAKDERAGGTGGEGAEG